MTIVSIGGGEIAMGETLVIDEHIVQATGIRNPRVLFVPTASGDSEGYCRNFDDVYRGRLGCEVSFLKVAEQEVDPVALRDSISSANAIYVGGGNTRFMLSRWIYLGIDEMLREAEKTGTVLSGLSAGAICWYENGLSDSNRFSEEPEWAYCVIDGLALRPGLVCPHLDVENRHAALVQAVRHTQKTAVACDNGAAIVWQGRLASVVTSLDTAGAYCYRPEGDSVSVEELIPGTRLNLSYQASLS